MNIITMKIDCPLCKDYAADTFEEINAHLETHQAFAEAVAIAKEVLGREQAIKRAGLDRDIVERAQRRATLDDGEYAMIPYQYDLEVEGAEWEYYMAFEEAYFDGDSRHLIIKLSDRLPDVLEGIKRI